jgi:hypothetical protein
MFEKLKAGNRPTFLEASFGNRVLGFLNAIMTAQITPAGSGKIIATETSLIIDLSPLQQAQQASQIALLSKQLSDAQGQITAINKALRSATITATCNPSDSTITVSLVIPGLP